MADNVALAGTIGTWVAVFLAILALAGILPAYLLVRTSRQEKNRAIAAVDDPAARFVSVGFRAPWLRGFRKVKVPNLRTAPLFNPSQPWHLRYPTLNLDPSLPDSDRSTTGWINFAQVIAATFTELQYASGAQTLEFNDNSSLLVVHCGWLLILTILHRYAYRNDFGLPVGSAVDADLELLESAHSLSGLSGVITTPVQSGRYHQSDNELRFRMHENTDLRQSLKKELIPLANLCFLFAGLLPGPSGVLLNIQRQNPSRTSRRRNSTRVTILRLVESRDPTSFQIRLLRLVGLKATKVTKLKPEHAVSELADELAASSLTGLKAKYLYIGQIKLTRDSNERFKCLLLRESLYTILLVYLESVMSPQSFLYDGKDDIVLRNVVRPNVFKETVRLAQKFIDRLRIQDAQRGVLASYLEHSATLDISGQEWSRTEMANLWRLDQALLKIPQLKDPRSLGVSMLYMHDPKFQAAVTGLLQVDVQAPLNDVRIDLEQNIVRLPDTKQLPEYQDFVFNFTAAFKGSHAVDVAKVTNNGALRELSYPLVDSIFACLRGHVRGLMWRRCLDPKGLVDFFRRLDPASDAYICSHTEISSVDTHRRRSESWFGDSDHETSSSESSRRSASNDSDYRASDSMSRSRRSSRSSEISDFDLRDSPRMQYPLRLNRLPTRHEVLRIPHGDVRDREDDSLPLMQILASRERSARRTRHRAQVNQPGSEAVGTINPVLAPSRARSL